MFRPHNSKQQQQQQNINNQEEHKTSIDLMLRKPNILHTQRHTWYSLTVSDIVYDHEYDIFAVIKKHVEIEPANVIEDAVDVDDDDDRVFNK